MVPRRTKVHRQQFKKLANGTIYYLASDDTGPFVKTGRRTRLTANTPPEQEVGQTTLADTSVVVKRVSGFLLNTAAVV
jgi:hypothetical protein